MLRNQIKRQSSFYACALCRQHQHDLAHLRSTGRIRTARLSSTSRPFSWTSDTILKLPTVQRPGNGTTPCDLLSRNNWVGARGYASWGKFGSQSDPGQSNATWGSSFKTNQASGTPGSAPRIPPATGTSAWGGTGTTAPGPATPTWGRAGRIPPVPSSPSAFVPRKTDTIDESTSRPKQPSATPSPQPPTVDAHSGQPQRPTASIHSTAEGRPSETRHNEVAPFSSPSATTSNTVRGSGLTSSTFKGSSAHQTPIPATGPGGVNSIARSGGSVSGQPLKTPWGKNAPGMFPPPSVGAPGKTMSGGPPGTIPGKSSLGASALWGQSGAMLSNPISGASRGENRGNPTLGGPAAWTSGKPIFGAPSTPAKGTSVDSGKAKAKSTSGLDASTWKQGGVLDAAPASNKPAVQGGENAVFKSSSQSWTTDPILDTMFTRPPTRQPPPGAEFPQLRRRSSRDDMFESMSPFKLPSREAWGKYKTPPPGSTESQLSAQLKSPSPEAAKGRGSGLSTLPKYEDHSVFMEKDVVSKEKEIGDFDQNDRGEAPTTTGSSLPMRPTTKQNIAPPDGARRGGASDRDVDFRGRDRGSHREHREYRGRGRDLHHFADPNHHAYATQDKANKRRKSGGIRKRNTDEFEEAEGFDDYQEARAIRKQRQLRLEEKRAAAEAVAPKTMRLPEYITVYDLAEALHIKPANFLHDLEQLGFENTLHDSVMTGETAALVAAEYGFEPIVESGVDIDLRPRPPPENPTSVPPRPPIVTIMGHVDHGKTTILDTLRKSSIVAQEFGGITQHIGAFSVKMSLGKTITFLDTPGHAAFLSMRQRGANVTDIVVLVVAVDDSVKPQTIEAIKHAQSAKVPMIVAINKIDVDNTPKRIDMVKQDLANEGVEIEDFGGDVQAVAISGKTGQGMRDLEDAILTLSEVLDVRAEPDGMAEGWVLEASIKPDGRAATILVKRGTLRIGDLIVAGCAYTRVRIMRNEAGVDVKEAGPGTPIEIYGTWKGEPMAGDMVLQAPNEPKAQAAVDYRQEIAERAIAAAQNAEREAQDREKAEQEALKKRMEDAEEADGIEKTEPGEVGPKLVSIIVRGDVMGSVEAVSMAIQEIGNNEVQPRILRSLPGQINESDVDHMATAKGAIVNFNSTIPGHVLQRADKAGVVILDHNIIYETVQAVKDLLSAQLPPIYLQRVVAEAQVAQIFPINITKRKYKNIAGVKITNGKVTRGGQYRVMRDGKQVYKGKLVALKQNKDDVNEVNKGSECGMMFDGYEDFLEGDLIQLYEDIEQKRYL